jgi:hypothetical protein
MCNLFVMCLLQHHCKISWEFGTFLTPKPSTGIYMNGECWIAVIFYADPQLWKHYRKKDVERQNVKLARWFVCRKKWSCCRMLCVTSHMLWFRMQKSATLNNLLQLRICTWHLLVHCLSGECIISVSFVCKPWDLLGMTNSNRTAYLVWLV